MQLQAELQALEPSELSEALVLEKLRGTRVEKADKPSASAPKEAAAPTPVASTVPRKPTANLIVNNRCVLHFRDL